MEKNSSQTFCILSEFIVWWWWFEFIFSDTKFAYLVSSNELSPNFIENVFIFSPKYFLDNKDIIDESKPPLKKTPTGTFRAHIFNGPGTFVVSSLSDEPTNYPDNASILLVGGVAGGASGPG